MDEEHNDEELEERLYAMLHYVDETQANVKITGESEPVNIVENAQRSTIRRYWRTSGDQNPPPTQFQKINTPPTQYRKVNTPPLQNQKPNTPREPLKPNTPREPSIVKTVSTANPKPKEEIDNLPPTAADVSIFQTPQIIQMTIEILDNDVTKSVVLESSDEDEVIEVALPPKPTITIDSSDEDDVCIVTKSTTPSTDKEKEALKSNIDRDSTSPVPSVVSSVSDDFIRGDCIALNISSRHPDNHTFDFSLHGSDLLEQTTPTKKKKKKKIKEINTSTPVAVAPNNTDACFATPKSKAKHKKQKSKSLPDKVVPSIDMYDSDSNQPKQSAYIVTDKSLPSADVYDSDSNQSEIKENVPCKTNISKDADGSESCISVEGTLVVSTPKTTKSINTKSLDITDVSIVDLTDNDYITLDRTGITGSIVMGNVTGFVESMDYGDEPVHSPALDPSKLGSTKIPPMLYDNLDFDNLKGKDKVCKRRRYSLTSLRAEMEKFYNESWGGEEFNHREIQKYMSRDKNLWVIDPKDKMPGLSKRRTTTCHYCDRPGHRDDMCRFKPPVCYMCGSTGHYEPRCPAKICVNCGSPNQMYSSMCRNCSWWPRVTCAECGQRGHPATHCPDLWRRYHNTIDINMPLEESRQCKKQSQLYCSGCTRRGHLIHTCHLTLPFSGLPINSPYVSVYRPLYLPTMEDNSEDTNIQEEDNKETSNQSQDDSFSSRNSKNPRNKRQSKSPCLYETQKEFKKKKQNSETSETNQNNEIVASKNGNNRKISTSKDEVNDSADVIVDVEKAPDFIPISSNNRDKKGQMIQDNEVSDTSDVVTVAKIFVTNDILATLKTEEGQEWLKTNMNKYNVHVQHSNESSFLIIKGKVADQESFQTELRDWRSKKLNSVRNTNIEGGTDENSDSALQYIPRKRELVLKIISKALDSLNNDLGEPKELYKELTFLQKQHRILQKQKVISPDKLSNSTGHVKKVLKKLNMVLLGQAGLANGRHSLTMLHALQQQLTHQSENTLPIELRKEIAQYYQPIFVAIERNDYLELVQKYHAINKSSKFKAKKNHNTNFDFDRNETEIDETNNSISPRSPNPTTQRSIPQNSLITDTGSFNKDPKESFRILTSYRNKLKCVQLKAKYQKLLRDDILRKLHVFINCLHRNERVSAKTVKKMRKIQIEARKFLNIYVKGHNKANN